MKLKIADRFINSFFPHDSLNPSIYNEGGKMKPAVHQAIMLVMEEFLDTIEYDLAISDIESVLLTGSLANYNYNKWSDADLHLLVDYSKFDEDKKFVRDYLRSKAINWNDRHKVTIYGHEIEIYFQDVNEPHHSTGIYDVTKDRWSVEPKKIDNKDVIDENLPLAFNKADYISIEIDKLASRQDDATIEKIDILKDKIKKMRQSGLERDGEYSIENIAFKILRRRGDLKLLHQAARIIADKNLSIPKILDEDQEWWKKRRSLDNKNYRELLGYSGKKPTFKRKYASKKTGYPKSANRRKIAKSGKPYMHNPRLKLGISAPPGVMQEREIPRADKAEAGTFSVLRALSNSTKIRDRVISNVMKNTKQKFLMLRKERRFATEKCLKSHSYEFIRSAGGWQMRLVGDIEKIKHPDNILIDPKECLYNQGQPMDLDEMGLINILDDELETGRAVEIKTDNGLSYHVPGFSTVVAIADKPAKKKKVVTPKPSPVVTGKSLLHQKLSAEKRGVVMLIVPKKDLWFTNFFEIIPKISEFPNLTDIRKWLGLITSVAKKMFAGFGFISYVRDGGMNYPLEAGGKIKGYRVDILPDSKVASDREHGNKTKKEIINSIEKDESLSTPQKKLSIGVAKVLMNRTLQPRSVGHFTKNSFLTKLDSETNNKICKEYIDCDTSIIIFKKGKERTKLITINEYLQGAEGAVTKISTKKRRRPRKARPFVPRSNITIWLDILRSRRDSIKYKDERQTVVKPIKTFSAIEGKQMQQLHIGLYKAIEQMDPKVREGIIQSWIKNDDQKDEFNKWHQEPNIKDKICKGEDLDAEDMETMPDLPYSKDDYEVEVKCPSGNIFKKYPSKDAVGSVFMSGRAFKVEEVAQDWLEKNGSRFGVVPVPDEDNTWYMPVAWAKDWEGEWEPDKDYSGLEPLQYIKVAVEWKERFKNGNITEYNPKSWPWIEEFWRIGTNKQDSDVTLDGIKYGFMYALGESLPQNKKRQFFTKRKDKDNKRIGEFMKTVNAPIPARYFTSENIKTFFTYYAKEYPDDKLRLTLDEYIEKYKDAKRIQGMTAWSAAFINFCMKDDPDFQNIPLKRGARGNHRSYWVPALEAAERLLKDKNLDDKSITWIMISREQAKEIGWRDKEGFGKVGDIVMQGKYNTKEKKWKLHGDIKTNQGRIGGNVRNSVRITKAPAKFVVTKSREAKRLFLEKYAE